MRDTRAGRGSPRAGLLVARRRLGLQRRDILEALGEVLLERRDYERALELYDQAVRAGATRPAVFYSAGVLNQQMGRAQNAIAYLERATGDSAPRTVVQK